MKLHSIYNSAIGVGLALTISKILPNQIGYRLADLVSGWIAGRQKSEPVLAVRTNQWVVSAKQRSGIELTDLTQRVFRAAGRSNFDFYHNLSRPEVVKHKVEIDHNLSNYFYNQRNNHGFVFVAPHLSNFEIVGRALALHGFQFQILSYPSPGSGYQWQNIIRKKSGLEVTPTSIESLHKARLRLREGGKVLTGLDRPISGQKYRPCFFGYPASLPVAYTRLALEAKASVVVVAAITKADGNYSLYASEPILMKSNQDLYLELIRNTEAVLEVAGALIRQYPDQWSMFYPVWPELHDETPGVA